MDIHSSLQTLDYAVIILYVIALLALGFWVSFRRDYAHDIFLGGRSLGWLNIGFSIYGTNISPSMMIGCCGIAYTSGMVAANFDWLAWFYLMMLAMMFMPHYLNTKVTTMPEFISRRFNNPCRILLSWYTVVTILVVWLGGVLYSGGVLFKQIMHWEPWLSILVFGTIATSFTVTGGLVAIAITDTFQVILMLCASATLTIIAFLKVGSIEHLVKSVPADYWQLLRSANDPHYPWPAVLLGYPVMGIWFWCTEQTIVQRVLGGRNLQQGQLGCVFASYIKIFTPFVFFLPGIFCKVLHPNLANPDEVYMTMVVTYLPAGLVGLIVSALIASLVSAVDAGLNSLSTIFTMDIYCNQFHPNATAKEQLFVGRILTLLAAAISVVIAILLGAINAMDLFSLLQSLIAFFAPAMAAIFIVGILWKRATSTAAFVTLVAGIVISLPIGVCYLMKWPNDRIWPHFLMLSFYLFAGLVALMVIISLLTKNQPQESSFPSLIENLAKRGNSSKLVWFWWILLAIIMTGIYVFFD